MYSDFTKMAHGNSRNSQHERFRQRFMHKLVYFPANNDGMYSCVGCGRCVEKCPSSLNIVKVIKAFEKHPNLIGVPNGKSFVDAVLNRNWVNYGKVEKAVNEKIVTTTLKVLPATSGNYAGMIGAALLAEEKIQN